MFLWFYLFKKNIHCALFVSAFSTLDLIWISGSRSRIYEESYYVGYYFEEKLLFHLLLIAILANTALVLILFEHLVKMKF